MARYCDPRLPWWTKASRGSTTRSQRACTSGSNAQPGRCEASSTLAGPRCAGRRSRLRTRCKRTRPRSRRTSNRPATGRSDRAWNTRLIRSAGHGSVATWVVVFTRRPRTTPPTSSSRITPATVIRHPPFRSPKIRSAASPSDGPPAYASLDSPSRAPSVGPGRTPPPVTDDQKKIRCPCVLLSNQFAERSAAGRAIAPNEWMCRRKASSAPRQIDGGTVATTPTAITSIMIVYTVPLARRLIRISPAYGSAPAQRS